MEDMRHNQPRADAENQKQSYQRGQDEEPEPGKFSAFSAVDSGREKRMARRAEQHRRNA